MESDEEWQVKARRVELRSKESNNPFKVGTLQVITPTHSTKKLVGKYQKKAVATKTIPTRTPLPDPTSKPLGMSSVIPFFYTTGLLGAVTE